MTRDATISRLTGVDLGPLEQRLRGTLLRPGMPAYDSARQLMNRAVTRRPAAIAQAADAQDVVEIVRFARDHSLPRGYAAAATVQPATAWSMTLSGSISLP
jgi:hypothetical protein